MTDPKLPPTRRPVLAALAAAAGPLLIVSTAVTPGNADDPVNTTAQAQHVMAYAAAHQTWLYLGLWLNLVAVCVAGLAAAASVLLVPGRGRRFVVTGSVFLAAGVVAEIVTASVGVLLRAAAARQGADNPTAQHVLITAFYHGAGIGEFGILTTALAIGILLIGIGLIRSHAVPRWVGWLLPVGCVIGAVIAPDGPVGAVCTIPLAVAYAGLAARFASGRRRTSAAVPRAREVVAA